MQELRFNISLAFKAIITNRLRSILTIVIIGIGIMSVVGILTAIEVCIPTSVVWVQILFKSLVMY